MPKIKYLICFFLFVCYSCTETDDNTIKKVALSKIIYGEQIGLGTYDAYYENDLLKELTSVSNNEKIKFEYSENGFISKREFFSLGTEQLLFRTLYTTNSLGQIVEEKNWGNDNYGMTYLGKQVFGYTNDKLDKIDYYGTDDVSINNTLQFIWDSQNPVLITWLGQDGLSQYSTNITYDLSKINKFNSIFPNSNELYAFEYEFLIWQSLSKNVPISSITNYNSGQQETKSYNYSLLSDGLTNEIYYNGQLWLKFEYEQ